MGAGQVCGNTSGSRISSVGMGLWQDCGIGNEAAVWISRGAGVWKWGSIMGIGEVQGYGSGFGSAIAVWEWEWGAVREWE